MLVLSRKTRQQLIIGDEIKITVLGISGNTIRLGIEAPSHIRVVRGELLTGGARTQENRPGRLPVPHRQETIRPSWPGETAPRHAENASREDEPTIAVRITDQTVSSQTRRDLAIGNRQELSARRATIPLTPSAGGMAEWLDTLSGARDS